MIEADKSAGELASLRAASLSPGLLSREPTTEPLAMFDDNPFTPDGSEQPPVAVFSGGLSFTGGERGAAGSPRVAGLCVAV